MEEGFIQPVTKHSAESIQQHVINIHIPVVTEKHVQVLNELYKARAQKAQQHYVAEVLIVKPGKKDAQGNEHDNIAKKILVEISGLIGIVYSPDVSEPVIGPDQRLEIKMMIQQFGP
jgi:hypothetical protein